MVIAFGEVLWDLLPTGPVMGGAPANVAFRLQELGTETHLVSKIGRDDLGAKLLEQLSLCRFSVNYVQISDKLPTGTVDVKIDIAGDAHYVMKPGVAYDEIEFDNKLLDLASKINAPNHAICFGTLIQRSPISRDTLYKVLEQMPDAWRILDVNLRVDCYSEVIVRRSFELANVLKLNQHEVQVIGDLLGLSHDTNRLFARKLIDMFGFKIVLVTLGKGGVLAYSQAGDEMYIPGYSVEVVDTVGAGDSFIAGFIHKLLHGESIEVCCEFGNLLGAIVASRMGGMPFLTQKEIAKFADNSMRSSKDVSQLRL